LKGEEIMLNNSEIDITPNDAHYNEAISFYQCGLILQDSTEKRIEDANGLFSPIVYLFRHSAELMLKALIIKNMNAFEIAIWSTIKLAPHNKRLSGMHSLKALYDTWIEQSRVQNQNAECLVFEEAENAIDFIDNFDSSSTFFRYPFNTQGERNRKELVENIDDDILSSLPCSLGALVFHEGPENFSCLHREQFLDQVEFDIVEIIQNLIYLYTGKQTDNG